MRPGDRVITLFAPECGKCIHCLSPRTNRCIAIRDQQGLGYLPDGTSRLARGDETLRHFMGTSTFAEATVMPEIALAKVGPDVPRRGREHLRLRALDRARRRHLHGPGRGRLDLRRVRLRARRPRRDRGLPAARRRAHRRHRPLGGAPRDGPPPRRDRHACWPGDGVVEALREQTGGYGVRLHVRGHRASSRSCARRSSRRARPGASRR